MSKTRRAYKYRFYPTDEQKRILAHTFGCVRFVYNFGLHTHSTAYKERGEKIYYNQLAAMLPDLKKQHPWLKEVSSGPIQQSLRHLDKAFVNFFEGRARYPTFKKKQNAQSATYASNAFKWEHGQLTLVKIDRFFPSSKTCHDCKHVVDSLPLDIREWVCPECGVVHDRDINAARNILTEGLSVSACGGCVRPVRTRVRRATPGEAGKSLP